MSETSKGIVCIITSSFFFALMAVFVKLSGNIHFIQKAFFRNVVAFFIALAGLLNDVKKNGKSKAVVPKGAWLFLILRAASGSFGVFGNFYAIDRIVLSDATILNKMAPFFAMVFSFIMLKEKINPVPFICIMFAFSGAVLVIKPGFDFTKMLPTLMAFFGGMGAGFAYSCVRKLSLLKCNGKIVILFFSTFSMMLCVPHLITSFEPMTFTQFICLCGAGVCAAGGQFSVTAAYYHAPANKISIYDYSQVIFSTLMGFFFFGQVPDLWSCAGYVIIISMALINFIYNRTHAEVQSESKQSAVIVSACLLGENCKYNGGNNYSAAVKKFIEAGDENHVPYRVVPVCPETAGGLPVPRVPAEIVSGIVVNKEGTVVDKEFRCGAEKCLEAARKEKALFAILQSRSPSCGSKEIYDGSFTGKKIPGQGVFAEMLTKAGIKIIDAEDLPDN